MSRDDALDGEAASFVTISLLQAVALEGTPSQANYGTYAYSMSAADRESVSNVVDEARIIPFTDNGLSAATQPGCPCRHQHVHVPAIDRARDERQQHHAP
jgi:hypothetical protein